MSSDNDQTAGPDAQAAVPPGAGDPFESGTVRVQPQTSAENALIVDVNGFEGPLDLLLALARHQKVDITRISILALAEQYLAFIAEIRRMRLELAADYLVMAAWLAYLKSRLLLPEKPDDDEEPSGEELAAHLAFRLQRLEAMREAAAALMTRHRLGRDIFARGAPEGIHVDRTSKYSAELYDLLKAYAQQREKEVHTRYKVKARPVITLRQAHDSLRRLVGSLADWARLDDVLAYYVLGATSPRSALASSLGASLEMARDGVIELRQEKAFAPIMLRRKAAAAGGR